MLHIRNLVRFEVFRRCSTVVEKVRGRLPRFSYQFMERLLDMDIRLCKMIVKDYPQFRLTSKYDMKLCVVLLRQAGYSMSYIREYVQLIALPPETLQNSLFFCQECGCYNDKIGPIMLKFEDFLNMRVSLLKSYGVIPDNLNVAHSFLYYLDVPQSKRNIETKDEDTIKKIYSLVYEYFIRNILYADDQIVSQNLKQREHYTSVRIMKRNLTLMRAIFGFDKNKFLELPHLLHGNPENVISKLKSQCAFIIKETMYNNPKLIAKKSFQDISRLSDYLQSQNIESSILINDPLALALNNDDLLYRLQKIIESPWLSVYKNHPRLPQLIRHYRIAQERIHILQQMNMKCFNANLLTCSELHFFQHIVSGIDQVSGADIIVYVATKLHKPVADVKYEMKKHQYLNFISILTIQENLEYLKKSGFTDDEIFKCVQILLYPKNSIEHKLNELVTNSIVVNDSEEIQVIQKKYFLPLTLYFIEKEQDFIIERVDLPKPQKRESACLPLSLSQSNCTVD